MLLNVLEPLLIHHRISNAVFFAVVFKLVFIGHFEERNHLGSVLCVTKKVKQIVCIYS